MRNKLLGANPDGYMPRQESNLRTRFRKPPKNGEGCEPKLGAESRLWRRCALCAVGTLDSTRQGDT